MFTISFFLNFYLELQKNLKDYIILEFFKNEGEKIMKTLTKYLMVIFLLTSTTIFADETRAEPGSRKLTEEQKKEIEQKQKQEIVSNQKNFQNLPPYIDNQYPPLVFDHNIHNIVGLSVLGDRLIIEDGSEWKIKPEDIQEVSYWKETHPILIVMNESFFSSYFQGFRYKMINAKTNTSIEVKLHLGPILQNKYTLQVAAINPSTCEVIFTDNTLWQCNPSEYYLLDKWLIGDTIIVGTNTRGWFNNTYDNMLINVNLLQEIKANRVE